MLLNKREKEQFLIDYFRHTHRDLSIIYNCSIRDVTNYAKKVGIHQNDSPHPCKWTDEQIEYIRKHIDKPYSFISLKLDLSESTVFRIKQYLKTK